jgi:hypothetical protein
MVAAQNHKMAKGDRGVMMVPLSVEDMRRMLAGGRVQLDPIWQPADEFIRIIRETPSEISAESAARWEQQLAVMDPRRDVALFLTSHPDKDTGAFYSRFIVTHDGSTPAN